MADRTFERFTVAISAVTGLANEIKAAPGAGRGIVVEIAKVNLDGNGEYNWDSGTTPLTGIMEVVADTADYTYMLYCGDNEALNLDVVTGTANGYVTGYIINAPGG